MDKYIITFIVPVYKVDYDQLRKCVQSILEQKGNTQPYEILLVNDGSPDDCPRICDEYAKEYANVHVYHQHNQGLSVVRNNGVKAALGEWVSFVDGDDWIESDFVEYAIDSLKRVPPDTDMIIWDGFSETKERTVPIKFFDSDDEELRVFRGEEKEKLIDRMLPRHVTAQDIKRCTDIGITWGRIYRKDFLKTHDIWNVPGLKVMQDSVFNLWAIEYARTVCYQYKPIYHYSMYDESISKKYDEHIADTMRVLYRHFSEYIKTCHDDGVYWQRLYIRTVRLLVKCLAKDYANPLNHASMNERVAKMRKDLSAEEFEVALRNCDASGQEIKFRVILFLLKHRMYRMSIIVSKMFGHMRRKQNGVS